VGSSALALDLPFAKPRTQLERWLKLLYAALPFGIIGSLVGTALGIEDAAVGANPGFRSTIVGALWGIAIGIGVGLLVCLTSRVSAGRS